MYLSSASLASSTPLQLAQREPRPELSRIEREYQVQNDAMVDWEPSYVGLFVDSVRMTATEGRLLDRLQSQHGLLGLQDFRGVRDAAFGESQTRFAGAGAEDGHQDAFRHAYWNALLTREFGHEFASQFATAHEGVPDNPSDREAMDLYNNEVGRRIATDNPDASPAQLADLVQQAVRDGELLVVDGSGRLAWSDSVALGATGTADGLPAGGGRPLPAGDAYPTRSN